MAGAVCAGAAHAHSPGLTRDEIITSMQDDFCREVTVVHQQDRALRRARSSIRRLLRRLPLHSSTICATPTNEGDASEDGPEPSYGTLREFPLK